ncbi:MAG TPA: ComF family protein [Candidatus Binatia bacterium]|nr:ComF family protein [Candidatus Binatia bacterium]
MVDWSALADGLLPPRCRFCDQATPRLAMCEGCIAGLPWNRPACPRCAQPQAHDAPCARCLRAPPPFDCAWAAFRLELPVHQEIHRLKYGAQFLSARTLGELMARELLRRPEALPQRLLPVPLHSPRLRRRGYNQAVEIARVLAQRTGVVVDVDSVERWRPTAHQTGQSRAQRRRNLKGAFRAHADLSGLRLALIDDVITTGATAGELARVCCAAGAARVEVWAAARTP